MTDASILVCADWDDEANVWVATSGDVEGLCIEADTVEALEPKVLAAIRDLLELNGSRFETSEIPVRIVAQHLAQIPNPHM